MTRADYVVVAVLTLVVGALYAATWAPRGPAQSVHIHVEGQRVASWELHQSREIPVEGAIGTSLLEIRDGRVRFVASPCRNKVCLHSGWLSESGDVAACVPNRVSLTLAGKEPTYDSINF